MKSLVFVFSLILSAFNFLLDSLIKIGIIVLIVALVLFLLGVL